MNQISPGEAYERVARNIQQVLHGKPGLVRLAVVCLFSEGHVLVEDVPGLGKTTLARSLAASVDGKLRRIQFTPDLLPSDVTGVMVYHQGENRFEFHPGGVFANVVLADEINRGTPKTQAALLEVMEERTVTVDSERCAVPRPFMVVATQNPIDMEGTYRLPEAQLDRFLMRLSVGYPDPAAEIRVLLDEAAGVGPEQLRPVLGLDALRGVIAAVRRIHIDEALAGYAVNLAAATRRHDDLTLGASPRGSVALIRAARAFAATYGREYVTPDDIKQVAAPVLAHRLILKPEAELRRRGTEEVLAEVLASVPVPGMGVTAVARARV
ncbi:AAA family ATPase [Actinoplanes sp. NPDC049265]|uniref:AAA family ATPase n=1 Tax=Actinoplanes sp. NPDC049265 TaxID=3363902 RepID=UPI00371CC7C6